MTIHGPARYIPLVIVDDIEEIQPEYDSVIGSRGLCYVCPECGLLWGKVVLFTLPYGADTPTRAPFYAVNSPCQNHNGGSLLDYYVHAISPWNTMRALFGPKVAEREMKIELERWNKK